MQETVTIELQWGDISAWKSIIKNAGTQSDEFPANMITALPMCVTCIFNKKREWTYTTNVLMGLDAPINRPRCELQMLCKILGILLRKFDTIRQKKTIVIVTGSEYLSQNATLARLHTWYKNGYLNIYNKDLWEQIRHGMERFGSQGIHIEIIK